MDMFKKGDIIKRKANCLESWFLAKWKEDDTFEVLEDNSATVACNDKNGKWCVFYLEMMELVKPADNRIERIENLLKEAQALLAELKN